MMKTEEKTDIQKLVDKLDKLTEVPDGVPPRAKPGKSAVYKQ